MEYHTRGLCVCDGRTDVSFLTSVSVAVVSPTLVSPCVCRKVSTVPEDPSGYGRGCRESRFVEEDQSFGTSLTCLSVEEGRDDFRTRGLQFVLQQVRWIKSLPFCLRDPSRDLNRPS